jgi:formate hydrogenlyase subunit 3/multisubunit Na+/H+ antiporter MnhD subunit
MSMVKIWTYAYWGEPTASVIASGDPPAQGGVKVLSEVRPPAGQPSTWAMTPAIGLLILATVVLGVGGGPVLDLMMQAGREVVDPSIYIAGVLGSPP